MQVKKSKTDARNKTVEKKYKKLNQ